MMYKFILITRNISYPFNWKSPHGYLIAVVLQCSTAFHFLHYLACGMSIALGSNLIVTLMNGFMENDLKSINDMTKLKKSETDIFESFSQFIQSYAEVKQLS